jgi:hypothetical protein
LLLDLVLGTTVVGAARAALRPSRTPRGRWLRTLFVLGAVAPLLAAGAAHRRMGRWGATDEELRQPLSGDELVRDPAFASTRAITVEAPAAAVWPWLVQMGRGRGGLYSYDVLENLAGCDIHSVDRVVPELQSVRVGDHVAFAPGQDTMVVAEVEPDRALVWQIADGRTGRAAAIGEGEAGVVGSWAFVLRPIDGASTRLIQRFRFDARMHGLAVLGYPLAIEVPHFVMERKMLLGIKGRAERAWRARAS